MILQRFSKALRQQDWFTVVIETLIVVFGVFIGLQVNNWNNTRLDAVEVRLMLERLQSDFAFLLSDSDEKIAALKEIIPMNASLQELIRTSDNTTSSETYTHLLASAFWLPHTPGSSETHAELVASGRMNLISSQVLRTALTAHSAQALSFVYSQQAVRERVRPYIVPLVRLRTLINEYPLEQAMTLAGQRSDMLVAIGLYENVFAEWLEQFEIYRTKTAATAEILNNELGAFQ